MDDRLRIAVLIIAKATKDIGAYIKAAVDSIAANCVIVASEQEADKNRYYEDLIRALNEFGGNISERMQELAEMAEDLPPITKKKIPRPPKSIGPVNKANYTANRPPRNARSSCRIIKRR